MTAPQRPPRTAAHATRAELLAQFQALGLQATISTNGSIPDADIQQGKALLREGGKHGEIAACDITAKGQARLDAARARRR